MWKKNAATLSLHRFWLCSACVGFISSAVSVNQNEINKTNAEDRSKQANKIWTILIDKINYSTRKTKMKMKKKTERASVKNWKHWFICGMPFKLASNSIHSLLAFFFLWRFTSFGFHQSHFFSPDLACFFSLIWLQCNPFHFIWNIGLLNANSLIHLPIDFQSKWNEFNTFVHRSIYMRYYHLYFAHESAPTMSMELICAQKRRR